MGKNETSWREWDHVLGSALDPRLGLGLPEKAGGRHEETDSYICVGSVPCFKSAVRAVEERM